jgi:hypothetical protein
MKSKRVSVSLNQYEFDLFNEALNTATEDNPMPCERKLLLRKAISMFSLAVIKRGDWFPALAVELRRETAAEMNARVAKQIPARGKKAKAQIIAVKFDWAAGRRTGGCL